MHSTLRSQARLAASVPAACLATLLAAVMMTGCERAADLPAGIIEGTVTSDEPIALPPGAVLELRLERSSEGEAPPELLAVQRRSNPGALPARFTLEYEPDAIDPQRHYSIGARVLLGEEVLLDTSQPVPVLTQRAPTSVRVELATPDCGHGRSGDRERRDRPTRCGGHVHPLSRTRQ